MVKTKLIDWKKLMADLRNIVDNTLVPHQAFEEATRRIEQCFAYSDNASEPICIALVGESRTGKSRVLEECDDRHPMVRNADGITTPILRVKTPSKPTVKSLAELMLRAMNDPRFDKGTENAKTVRLQTLMKNCGTRMVMIDEFQHFVDKGSQKVMHHVADWLKILVDDSRVALVVAGLPTCQAVLDQNEQLAGRFLSPLFMPRFDWHQEKQREEFEAILGAFYESLSDHFDLPVLDGPEMAFRCYCGTGGLMGYLSKFLRKVIWNAIDCNQKCIRLADLARAHQESVWDKASLPAIPNPFAEEFAIQPTDDLIARIMRIGTAIQTPPETRRKKTSHNSALTVREVLAAS